MRHRWWARRHRRHIDDLGVDITEVLEAQAAPALRAGEDRNNDNTVHAVNLRSAQHPPWP